MPPSMMDCVLQFSRIPTYADVEVAATLRTNEFFALGFRQQMRSGVTVQQDLLGTIEAHDCRVEIGLRYAGHGLAQARRTDDESLARFDAFERIEDLLVDAGDGDDYRRGRLFS